MTDVEKILWGALGGVAVYIAGQLLSKFFIEPLYELRKTVGEVRFNLAFHPPTIHTPIGRTAETSNAAQEALMKSSCDLIANLHAVPGYGLTRILAFGSLPSRKQVEKAAVQLRGLSTYVHEAGEKAVASIDAINKRFAAIMHLLRLKPLDGEDYD
jgi:hypothetical protein